MSREGVPLSSPGSDDALICPVFVCRRLVTAPDAWLAHLEMLMYRAWLDDTEQGD